MSLEKFVIMAQKAPEGSEMRATYQFMIDRMTKMEEDNEKLKEQLIKLKEEKKAAGSKEKEPAAPKN